MATTTPRKTVEDFKYCPKCSNPGKIEESGQFIKSTCMNERCPEFELPRIAQVRADGLLWEGDRET